jgi:hypothetical protein
MTFEKTFFTSIIVVTIILYPIIFFWQCGDLTDSGYLAYNYDNFSNAIDKGTFLSETIVTNFVGYNWMRLFPGFEILGLKILFVLMTYLSIFLAYQPLKKYGNNKNLLLFSLLIAELIFIRCISFTFNKDIMSWGLILASLAFLTATRYVKLNLFLSGFIIIFAIFSRLPNVVLIPIYILFLYFQSKSENRAFVQFFKERLFYLISGLFLGLIIFNFMIWKFSILDQFYQNFSLVKKSMSSDASSYSIFTLLKIYLKEMIVSLKQFVVIFPSFLVLNWIYGKRESLGFKIAYFICVALFSILCYYYYQGFSYSSKFKYLPMIFCAFPLFVGALKIKQLREFIILICSLSLIQVFGSNTGLFLKLSYGMVLLLPTAIIVLSKENKFDFWKVKLESRPIIIITLVLLGGIALVARIGGVYHVTEGITSRLTCVYPVDIKKMYGIYTTKERKDHVESLTKAIKLNCPKSKKVFIYGHQPLFYFLTNTTPLEGTAWLKNKVVSEEAVFKQLNTEIQENEFLIVDTKEKVFGEKGEKDLKKILQMFNFRKVSESRNYVIWKTVN